jgi:hypothetical protein
MSASAWRCCPLSLAGDRGNGFAMPCRRCGSPPLRSHCPLEPKAAHDKQEIKIPDKGIDLDAGKDLFREPMTR